MAELVARPRPDADGRSRPDGALIRSVRLRLLLWSGGSTLVVLAVLGTLIYAVVARSLASSAVDQLQERAQRLAAGVAVGAGPVAYRPGDFVTDVASAPGIVIGGSMAWTMALLVPPEGLPLPTPNGPIVSRLISGVDDQGLAIARLGEVAVTESELGGTPVRVLSVPLDLPEGRFVAQVVLDRTGELRTLQVLLLVLLGGGLVALLAALGVGWLYAERALVPIRDALRRQREFAADASHELRTPLSVVKASVEHLRRHGDAPAASVGTALDDIDSEVDRLTSLVDELLLLARTDSGTLDLDRVACDLAEIVLDAAGALTALAERTGIRLLVDAAPARLLGDPARIRQLLTILVDNAVRHTPAGGEVRISVIPDDGSMHVLRVEDGGPGIRPEHLPHIFDRFWRAPDAPAGGTGLGLAIAVWIVERHGGSIKATNRLPRGARFDVRLPAS